jgi:type VI secretion system protein ImpH
MRRTSSDLEELYQSGYKFGLFQAVRLLQRNHPERLGVGFFGRSTEEVVRFCGHNSLVFPPGIIHSISESHPNDDGSQNHSQARIEVSVLGLTGYAGVLPAFYTEQLIRANLPGQPNNALSSFLDLFNHRLISLSYRCWERARPHIACERLGSSAPWTDYLSQHVFALMGLGTPLLRARSPVEPEQMIRYAGLLSYKSATSLEAILTNHFGFSFQVAQFRGRWCALEKADRAQLNMKRKDGQLGFGAMAGRVAWYPQASFRVRVQAIRRLANEFGEIEVAEPLRFNEFYRLLPGTAGFDRLLGMINYFTCERFETFDIELTLQAKEIPRLRLGCDTEHTARLGWSSWLGGRVMGDSVSAVFGTRETITRVRVGVNRALRGLRASLSRLRQLDLRWSEDVIDQIVSSWKRSRLPAAAYSQTIANEIMQGIVDGVDEAQAKKLMVQKATILASEQGLLYRID